MPKNAVRLNDMTTGHGCFPPQKIIEASPNVNANGRGVARDGDAVEEHICKANSHGGTIQASGGTVFINGKPVAKILSPVSCGGKVMTGSGNVFFG